VLRFQTQPGTSRIGASRFPDERTVEEIAGVKLNTWLGCKDLQRSTTRRLEHPRRRHKAIVVAVHDEVMVVSASAT